MKKIKMFFDKIKLKTSKTLYFPTIKTMKNNENNENILSNNAITHKKINNSNFMDKKSLKQIKKNKSNISHSTVKKSKKIR